MNEGELQWALFLRKHLITFVRNALSLSRPIHPPVVLNLYDCFLPWNTKGG